MSFVYTPWFNRLALAQANHDTLDLRILIVMTNTTADTDEDATTIAGIGTLDEYDGANYVRKDPGDLTVTSDTANDRTEVTFAGVSWAGLGVGTRQAAGFVLYEHVTNDADSRPIAFIDEGGFPFSGNGGQVDYTPHATDGAIIIRNAA